MSVDLGKQCVISFIIYGLKRVNPLHFYSFISILIISCLPNVFKKTCHDTVKNQFSAEHIGGLVSIQLCHIMNQLRTKYRNLLAIISLYLIISFLTNVSNKPYHVTGEYPLSEQHWRSTSKWCLEKIMSYH